MIYDCFNFYNELDLLDIRLHELDNVIDQFILVESTVTFTNKKKPLYFKTNKSRFKKFHKKIIHIIVNDSPNVTNPWIIEQYQLSAVARGLKYCKKDDTILISCIDEIPIPEKILQMKDAPEKHKVFMQIISRYYLNLVSDIPWEGTRMFSYKDLCSYQNPYIARFSPIDIRIPNGGWHFTYLGGVKMIQKKLESFSHQEYNNEKYNTPEKILQAIAEGRDLFSKDIKLKLVTDDFLPQYVQQNKQVFRNLILSPKDKKSLLYEIEIFLLQIKDTVRIFTRKIIR